MNFYKITSLPQKREQRKQFEKCFPFNAKASSAKNQKRPNYDNYVHRVRGFGELAVP